MRSILLPTLSKLKTLKLLKVKNMSLQDVKRMKVTDKQKERLVWVDLEDDCIDRREEEQRTSHLILKFHTTVDGQGQLMSGLDVSKEHILEMACIITDQNLNVVAESEDLVIHQDDSVLDNMGDWCTEHHGQSGLTEAVRKSKISLVEAEDSVLKFVEEYTMKGSAPLAGNTVHMDRIFLSKYMPRFTEHLHYRIVDVSTVKELTRRWYPSEFSKAPKKALSHRALDDIKESIEELKYYREAVFKKKTST